MYFFFFILETCHNFDVSCFTHVGRSHSLDDALLLLPSSFFFFAYIYVRQSVHLKFGLEFTIYLPNCVYNLHTCFHLRMGDVDLTFTRSNLIRYLCISFMYDIQLKLWGFFEKASDLTVSSPELEICLTCEKKK